MVHGDPAHDLGPLPAAGPLLDRLLEPLGLGPLRLGEQRGQRGLGGVGVAAAPMMISSSGPALPCGQGVGAQADALVDLRRAERSHRP